MADELYRWSMPEKFEGFLDNNSRRLMSEAGRLIKILIDKFGKDKLFEFLKKQKGINEVEDLKKAFYELFKDDLSYDIFNQIAKS